MERSRGWLVRRSLGEAGSPSCERRIVGCCLANRARLSLDCLLLHTDPVQALAYCRGADIDVGHYPVRYKQVAGDGAPWAGDEAGGAFDVIHAASLWRRRRAELEVADGLRGGEPAGTACKADVGVAVAEQRGQVPDIVKCVEGLARSGVLQ